MAEAVLDASAILALLQEERGADRVEPLVENALVCSVNLSEVLAKLVDKGASPSLATTIATSLPFQVVDFDLDLACRAGQLRDTTRKQGLSLGDRACLALAEREGLPALTTDRGWSEIASRIAVDVIR
ncbi:type II toxin-antitoxin system VapC family toxin [Brevundimonas aurifodinae]|uniref:Type II toxin-antitoxin system VapC family toxin n=2 Tax=Brevundimonas TaxID=41275 RepID=A0ABV1NSM9_9CAUL|nr:MAG: VapC toxin family PIN domain ribonuclease [Brevundimonas sp. 12-68-7]OYX32232.1 MAG: VapC toxin family PIN domain ribonuclease [Brevundimonas subvibrioides]